MNPPSNLFEDLPAQLPDEIVQTLVSSPNVRIERIISHGHASPEGFWFDQPTDEWVLLVKGAGRIRFEDGRELEMIAGSFVNIATHQRHRVEWTDPNQPTIWLAIHYSA
jgi:cupin 2 domain-containing protein